MAISPFTRSRRILYRWTGWFFLINVLLSLLIGLNYLGVLPDFSAVAGITTRGVALGWAFLLISFLAQLAILFFIFGGVVIAVITLFPRKWLVFSLSIVFTVVLVFGLLADSMAFKLYQMHYAGVAWSIFKAGAMSEVILLSLPERIMLIGAIVVLLAIEYVIAVLVWRRITKQKISRLGYVLGSVVGVCVVASYGLMFVATALASKEWLSVSDDHLILKAARLVPYYNEIYGLVMPGDSSVRRIESQNGEIYFQVREANRPINYPLHPVQCVASRQPLNVLVIGIDTWRYDAMNKTVTPNIYQFAQKTLQFQNQWSGGNCTKPGVFSLFYGLPANYWSAFLGQGRSPVMMEEMIKNHYQMGIFTSAPLNFPAFNETIFRDVKNLMVRTPGESSVIRDRAITTEFINFLNRRDKTQPFFSFLFYDAVHNYCESASPMQEPFSGAVESCDRFSLTPHSDPTPYINRYHNAVYFVDSEVQKVLDAVEAQGLLRNTIVIITADHGEQINDERMGYWDHASAYTPYQLHVPLLVYWPGKNPRVYSHFTTHYDVVPTLMQQVLGCQNPVADYSVGESLFTEGNRPYLISGSYADYAVVTQRSATRIYPGGDYVIDDPKGHPLYGAQLDRELLQKAFRDLNRYFQW